MLDQAAWFEDVQHVKKEVKKMTLTGLGHLIDEGTKLEKAAIEDVNFRFHSSCSMMLTELRQQQSVTKNLEKVVQSMLAPGLVLLAFFQQLTHSHARTVWTNL